MQSSNLHASADNSIVCNHASTEYDTSLYNSLDVILPYKEKSMQIDIEDDFAPKYNKQNVNMLSPASGGKRLTWTCSHKQGPF
jgi:hypothetical protein